MPIAIIAALEDEIRVLRSKMVSHTRVHLRPAIFDRGVYLGREIILARSGVGKESMKKAIDYLLKNYSPKLCLHVGYCGATDPYYQAGDLVIAGSVVDSGKGKKYLVDELLVEQALKLCREKGMRAKCANLVTTNKVVSSSHEKAFMGTQYNAHGIDMESSAFAASCEAAQIPYLIVRSVFDPLDECLPDMGEIVDKSGQTDKLAIAGFILKHPKDVLKLPKFQYLAMKARQSILMFIDCWLEETVNRG